MRTAYKVTSIVSAAELLMLFVVSHVHAIIRYDPTSVKGTMAIALSTEPKPGENQVHEATHCVPFQ